MQWKVQKWKPCNEKYKNENLAMKSTKMKTLQWKVLKWEPCKKILLKPAMKSITNWPCNETYYKLTLQWKVLKWKPCNEKY